MKVPQIYIQKLDWKKRNFVHAASFFYNWTQLKCIYNWCKIKADEIKHGTGVVCVCLGQIFIMLLSIELCHSFKNLKREWSEWSASHVEFLLGSSKFQGGMLNITWQQMTTWMCLIVSPLIVSFTHNSQRFLSVALSHSFTETVNLKSLQFLCISHPKSVEM